MFTKRLLSLFLILSLCVFVSSNALAAANISDEIDILRANVLGEDITDAHPIILKNINELRARQNLPALKSDETLAKLANVRAYALANQSSISGAHTLDVYGGVKDTVSYFGMEKLRFYAENLAFVGKFTTVDEAAETAMNSWINSTGHYENIMRSEAENIGISVIYAPDSHLKYKVIAVTVFS